MKIFLYILFFIIIRISCFGQLSCAQHWSKNSLPNTQLDSILSNFSIPDKDTSYCDSFALSHSYDHKWYISFYNKHIGNYFTNAESVNFWMLHFKLKSDTCMHEIHVTQFSLPDKKIDLIRKKYGTQSEQYESHIIKPYNVYKHIIIGRNIYFITTESFWLKQNHPIILDRVFDRFVQYGRRKAY